MRIVLLARAVSPSIVKSARIGDQCGIASRGAVECSATFVSTRCTARGKGPCTSQKRSSAQGQLPEIVGRQPERG